jgi:hypothetical protein
VIFETERGNLDASVDSQLQEIERGPGGPPAETVMTDRISLAPYLRGTRRASPMRWTGQVTEVVGLLIESRGPNVAIGDFCEVLASPTGGASARR